MALYPINELTGELQKDLYDLQKLSEKPERENFLLHDLKAIISKLAEFIEHCQKDWERKWQETEDYLINTFPALVSKIIEIVKRESDLFDQEEKLVWVLFRRSEEELTLIQKLIRSSTTPEGRQFAQSVYHSAKITGKKEKQLKRLLESALKKRGSKSVFTNLQGLQHFTVKLRETLKKNDAWHLIQERQKILDYLKHMKHYVSEVERMIIEINNLIRIAYQDEHTLMRGSYMDVWNMDRERASISTKAELIVIADVHVAKSWDEISDTLRPQNRDFLNPNFELRKLVQEINMMQNVVAVIHNGDNVDYQYTDYKGKNKLKSSPKSNWEVYQKITGNLQKPVIETLGNHDYRREPYNYAIYGLKHVNIPDEQRKRKLAGYHDSFRKLNELESVSRKKGKHDPQAKLYGLKLPAFKRLGPYNCIFLDSGNDVFGRLTNMFKYFWKLIVKKETKGLSVDVEGLHDSDIKFIKRILSEFAGERVFIFVHAPLIHSKESNLGQQYNLPKKNLYIGASKQGLGSSVMMRKGSEFLNSIAESHANVTIIASHVHTQRYYLIDKTTLIAREVDLAQFNAALSDHLLIKHATTMALGGIHGKGSEIGYLKITPKGLVPVVVRQF